MSWTFLKLTTRDNHRSNCNILKSYWVERVGKVLFIAGEVTMPRWPFPAKYAVLDPNFLHLNKK